MKFTLLISLVVTLTATAQELRFETAAAEAWFETPYEERERRFDEEGLDPDWTPSMEQAIRKEIAAWHSPPVQLLTAECRETLCRIETHWPRNVGLAETGQQLSYLRRLGLDHQGQTQGGFEGNSYRWAVILRRL